MYRFARQSWVQQHRLAFPGPNIACGSGIELPPSVSTIFADHTINEDILFPGVGYVELAFASDKSGQNAVLAAVAFVRPCQLEDRCLL